MAIAGALVVNTGMGPASALLIGIGNPLRGDDGVAPWLVETWGRRRAWRAAAIAAAPIEAAGDPPDRGGGERLAGLRIRLVDQLLPELAEELAAVRRVLFVDAWPVAPAVEPSASGASRSRPKECHPPGRELQSSELQSSALQSFSPRLLSIAAPDRWAPGPADWGSAGWTPGHQLTPPVLLQLTAALYGRAPVAQGLLIPATTFAATEPGAGPAHFSAPLRSQLPRAWRLLDQWLQEERQAAAAFWPNGRAKGCRAG